ncbi:MAG: FAD:protein FMN transferase, partial [Planctomycetes bacterium]|nr:FAD:protein FMN transferase [Planctomycetota bacterium]
VRLWQFGPDPSPALPTEEELDATLTRVGLKQLEVRLDPPALCKLRPDVEVDLSGIAKGYGVDAVARLLNARGLSAYLVEIGGEVRTRGTKPDGSRWTVGIEAPTPGRRSVRRTIELSGASMATSGDYRSFRDTEGRRWSHTIDPRTGRPIAHQLASVTVVSDSCMESDALATALMVLGPEGAYDWSRANHVAALLIVRDGGSLVDRPTPEFARRFPPAGPGTRHPMTTTILLSAAIIGLAMAAMAVGLLGRRRLRGSCGGLSSLCRAEQGQPTCDACQVPAAELAAREDAGGERDR